MSILFGLLKERGALAFESDLDRMAPMTAQYAAGSAKFYVSNQLGMGVQPYVSHKRSEVETGPRVDVLENAISFDGRLDNHVELASMLGLSETSASDSDVVLAAFRHWGDEFVPYLMGDWAFVLWSANDQSLYMARDHAGTRMLHFRIDGQTLQWATYLDTFAGAGPKLQLSESYIAAYLSGIQIRDLTPYKDVYGIPPAHYVVFRNGRLTKHRYWSPSRIEKIVYATDRDYEEMFVRLFQQSVERRSGEGETVLAELSGGMDSTSIVCVSDKLRKSLRNGTPLLDTVSYFDDNEDSLDEKRYFSITEARRGKVGAHLEMAYARRTFEPHDPSLGRYYLPGADSLSIQREEQFQRNVWRMGYRSILSGIGGDELLGGVPDPNPELGGYLTSGAFAKFCSQSMAWSLVDRTPVWATVANVLRYAVMIYSGPNSRMALSSWLSSRLQEAARGHLKACVVRERWGYSPQQLNNERTWWAIMETLPHLFPRILARPEYRYPYLDKDLVQFLLAVPRDQLLRPGRRRALMRRSLAALVPQEVLERRRKAFQIRAPLRALAASRTKLEKLFERSILIGEGYVDGESFIGALRKASEGDSSYWQSVIRVIAMELWLQSEATARVSFTKSPEKALAV
jgi:asparagine synthase (glutamine-hydrolysing)